MKKKVILLLNVTESDELRHQPLEILAVELKHSVGAAVFTAQSRMRRRLRMASW